MSFSSDVKLELIEQKNEPCCQKAEAYGLLLFSRSFSANSIEFLSEQESLVQKYNDYVVMATGKPAEIKKTPAGNHKLIVRNKEQRLKLLSYFGHDANEVSLRINLANLSDECCSRAFIRGAFLSCGTITDPEKEYHLEFTIPYKNLTKDFVRLCEELGFSPKTTIRQNNHIVYFKDSTNIEDLLTAMGATNASLSLMGIKMYKSVINNTNRRVNFDKANIKRSTDSAMIYIDAIRTIEKAKGLNSLPSDLKELAMLRLENPDMSQKELAASLSVPISLSAVNRRLKKLVEIADSIRTSSVKNR
ncbi:MAG TPA: DNA-binding protein WhiA [Clostridiales bacterium]|jgi:DNA-binding protein WhiA|nr:DNA-binding protein WhiA [Clostridiales bacterium]HPU67193.1 DNA-binding protein WhiA [Clostridiales bacterium]HQA05791.1 DNA-binding protein WhiA [Clostridiales bacterium]HQD72343.1 DNA-binding protein WhiA [Clostridiales bacterium]